MKRDGESVQRLRTEPRGGSFETLISGRISINDWVPGVGTSCEHVRGAQTPFRYTLAAPGKLDGPPIAACRRMITGHPPESDLQARAEFRLSLHAARVVDDHLRVCPACNARYRDIAKEKPSPPPAPGADLTLIAYTPQSTAVSGTNACLDPIPCVTRVATRPAGLR